MGFFMAKADETRSPDKNGSQEMAVFAGGCFWCMEEVFDDVPGIMSAISGFTGGYTKNPTYKEVSAGGTGHLESVQITFNPSTITYDELLELFWKNIDPFDAEGQFCDKGDSYQAAIFYTNEIQKEKAENSKKRLKEKFKTAIVTQIRPLDAFYSAEEYHQKYAQKNPLRYRFYRTLCGRDKRLKELKSQFSSLK
jgi:peptide-methionine (S)-S-oxide reductase